MPYVDDLAASGAATLEVFNAHTKEKIEIVSKEIAESMFPGVALSASENIRYFPFKLCHSYPAVNARGRTFMPKVLQNSFASLNDQLVDMDHMLKHNEFPTDRIVGCVKATAYAMPEEVLNETASLESLQPIPVKGLGVLFLRAHGVQEVVDRHESGKMTYGISMECGHKWKDALLSYRGELIPLMDAELAMRDCIKPDQINQFKGYKVSACLGGLDGSVDFWGCAITASPADENADILNFFSVQSKEAASRKQFYMPMRAYRDKDLEIAHTTVDKKLSEEVASITVIGQTDPDELDGHVHPILSDLTILPANGHIHCFRSQNISRGSSPTLTGLTDAHHYYPPVTTAPSDNYREPIVHMHLISLPLKGKFKSDTANLDTDTENSEEADMPKTLKEISATLKTLTEKKLGVTDEAARLAVDREIASASSELAAAINEGSVEKERADHVDGLIQNGTLMRRDAADALITEKVNAALAEQKKQHEAELKATQVRQSRIDKCAAAGIELDTEFEGINGEDGKPMTLLKKLDTHTLDDAGERSFNMDFALWQNLGIFKEEEVVTEKETELVGASANKSGASNGKIKKILSTVAGGGSGGVKKLGEIASKETKKHLIGKSRFS